MLMRLAERFPGGRLLVFALPVILLCLGMTTLHPAEMIQLDNAEVLVLGFFILIGWWEMISIFLHERQEAFMIWLSLGVATIITTAECQMLYSFIVRLIGMDPDDPANDWLNNRMLAIFRFAYAFGFGCLYLVPYAKDEVVPPRRWRSLFAIVFTTAVVTVSIMRLPIR